MDSPHCSLDYHGFRILKFETFAAGVKTGVYSNPLIFTSPPLTEAQFQTLIENNHHSYDDYKNGGKLLKPAYLAAKALLMKGLDDTATYIDGLVGVDENMINKGGYNATKVVDSEGQVPAQPAGATITRGGEGEMFAEVPKIDGAVNYGCIAIAGQPLPAYITLNASGQFVMTSLNTPDPNPTPDPPQGAVVAVMDVSKSRKKRFLGLQSGVKYYFYFYASNATGVSILSEVRSMICG